MRQANSGSSQDVIRSTILLYTTPLKLCKRTMLLLSSLGLLDKRFPSDLTLHGSQLTASLETGSTRRLANWVMSR